MALILAGSGPLDRDGNMKGQSLNISRDLAALVTAQGWGSLRFDKRGVGASGGDYLSTGFFDELSDIEAAYDWLATEAGASDIFAIGHSIGATFAVGLAGTRDLSGVVALALNAKLGEETSTWQAMQMKDTLLPKPLNLLLALVGTDLVKQQRKTLNRLKATTGDVARIRLAWVNARWMREFMAYDPVPALKKVVVPMLAITGSKDVQVDPSDLQVVAEYVPTAETQLIPDADHILRHEPAEVSNPRLYRKQATKPFHPRIPEVLDGWLNART